MSKKKKRHKKSRQKRRTQNTTASKQLATPDTAKSVVSSKPKNTTKQGNKPKPKQSSEEDVEIGYVKADVGKTLILVGAILVAYVVIWVLITYTNVQDQVIRVIT